jgi:prolyl-tRNA editing enzyme YbaK/EbsC (Cys-tRNA(Pro) deacylase)
MAQDLHPMTDRIKALLDERGLWHEEFHHDAVTTSVEAAATRPGYSLHQGAKALVMRCKPRGGAKRFVLCVLPADMALDNKQAKLALDAKDIRFATSEEVATITDNILPGAIPPFGNLFDLSVVMDKGFDDVDTICFNAGGRRYSIGMKLADYLAIVAPLRATIAKAN